MEFTPGTDRYVEVVDHALTTTHGVRMRLDLERAVDDQVLLDCIDVAEQAPTGGNIGSRRWMIVREQATKDCLADLYLAAGGSWVIETAERLEGTDHLNARMMQGAKRLAESIALMPALVIPTKRNVATFRGDGSAAHERWLRVGLPDPDQARAVAIGQRARTAALPVSVHDDGVIRDP